MEHRFKDKTLYAQLVHNISQTGLNFIFYEAKQVETTGPDILKCGCTTRTTYGLPCACIISK